MAKFITVHKIVVAANVEHPQNKVVRQKFRKSEPKNLSATSVLKSNLIAIDTPDGFRQAVVFFPKLPPMTLLPLVHHWKCIRNLPDGSLGYNRRDKSQQNLWLKTTWTPQPQNHLPS
jgi:hypothetical protein